MFVRVLSIPRALNILELEYTRVMNMKRFYVNCTLKILSVLIVLNYEYVKVLNVSRISNIDI